MIEIWAYGLVALATLVLAAFGVLYSNHKKLAITLFGISFLILDVAVCLFWFQKVNSAPIIAANSTLPSPAPAITETPSPSKPETKEPPVPSPNTSASVESTSKSAQALIPEVKPMSDKKTEEAKQQPTVSQTMTNSPGGIQAGGNVTIHQKPERRALTPEQSARLLAFLRSQNLKGHIEIKALFGDSEAAEFASQIDKVLRNAGWTTSGVSHSIFTETPVGLIIQVHDSKARNESAAILQHALASIGFTAEGHEHNQIQPGKVVLIVGRQ